VIESHEFGLSHNLRKRSYVTNFGLYANFPKLADYGADTTQE
jgi:hypothetical protein